MEIQFLHETFTGKDPKLLIDHIQRMVSGEAPFFPATLSLVYDRLAEQKFPKNISFSSGPWGFTTSQTITTPTPPVRTSPLTFGITSPPTSNIPSSTTTNIPPLPTRRILPSSFLAPTPTPRPVSPNPTVGRAGLRCVRCCEVTPVKSLYSNLLCPWCSAEGKNGKGEKGRPFMRCTECNTLRDKRGGVCLKPKCRRQFA